MLMILLLFLYLLLLSCVTSLFIWLGSIVQHYCSIFIHLTLLFPHLLQIHLGKKTQFWLNLTIIRSLTELKQQYSFVENNTTAFSTYFKIMTTLSDGNSIQPLLFICPNKYTLLLSVMMISELFCFLKPPLFPSLLTPNCEYLITVHKTK